MLFGKLSTPDRTKAYRRSPRKVLSAPPQECSGRVIVLIYLLRWWRRPLDLPDPVEAIKYHMGQNGLQPRDLIPFIGSRNRVHEVLNRKRPLTLKMIWRLHEGLGIPAESLIKSRAA